MTLSDDREVPRRRFRPSNVITLGAGTLLTLLWALLCEFLLEMLQDSSISALFYARPWALLLNALVIWSLLLFSIAVSGRLWAACAVLMGLTLFIGLANRLKLQFRHEPLFPSDATFGRDAGFLGSVVGARTIIALALLIVLSTVASLWLGRLSQGAFPSIDLPRIVLVCSRLLIGVAALAVLVQAAHFNQPGNQLRRAFDASGVEWAPYNQWVNYRENGFVAGLLYNTRAPAMPSPAGYGEARMNTISEAFSRAAADINWSRDPSALDDVNVVMVLSESFSDPTRLAGVSVSEDPIPFTHSLKQSTITGTMLSSGFGGGTSNLEFEALTGMSTRLLSPQAGPPYQTLIPRMSSFPSVVGLMRKRAHKTIAIHPFDPSFYRRGSVYPVLGFDESIFRDSMHDGSKLPGTQFISDSTAFNEVRRQIRDEESPLFINLVTMQNHTPYLPHKVEPYPVAGLSGTVRLTAQAYMRQLRASDDALREFLGSLERSDEKTIVLLYGDHQPGFWPPSVWAANGAQRMHETPFLLWSNFSTLPKRSVRITSPSHFAPMILDAIGAPIPPYYALLDDLASRVPAMEGPWVLGPDGRDRVEDHLPGGTRELMAEYRMVQYDFSVGNRYALKAMFYDPAAAGTEVSASGR